MAAFFECFNPRPPLLAGESPSKNGIPLAVMFQSTPAIAGGRIFTTSRRSTPPNWFQSTPAIAGGRIAIGQLRTAHFHAVSIHARHCWRANPAVTAAGAKATTGFNPRPPLLAGESTLDARNLMSLESFNPRPPLLAGESTSTWRPMPLRQFQSTPAIAGGRIRVISRTSATKGGFQSTPAIAGGRIA